MRLRSVSTRFGRSHNFTMPEYRPRTRRPTGELSLVSPVPGARATEATNLRRAHLKRRVR